MKNVIITLLCFVVVLVGASLLIEKKEQKEKAERDSSPILDNYVYVDSLKCLHIDKHCFNLGFDNYAVKIYKKNDPRLEEKFEYLCVDCWDPNEKAIEIYTSDKIEIDW